MRAGGDHATAEQERLALYLMGALDDAERESFEEHLAGCWHCLDEAAAIGPSVAGLAGLGDADWALPTSDPIVPAPSPAVDPVLPASSPAVDSVLPAPSPAVDRDVSGSGASASADVTDTAPGAVETAGGPASTADAGPVRPAGSRPPGRRPTNSRPGSTAASWRRRRAVWAGAAALVLALAGGVVAVNQWTASPDPVLTASGEAPGYGASLSVTITVGDQGSATIRITATGLRQGLRYRLFAVTRDGATHVVRDWTASAGPQEVAGETSLPVDQLSFITVGLVDGSAIVTAPIAQGPASPR
ncbi:Putative zinc-finger [Micromonospora phaseoli]|uniref:Putative zinc-finger n=1 Tax=Micromonospora phaseoli TaxID=1144548 RepID=A0A1H6XU29_9ACTN|nr:zf-HC2 domain-containing protein [Micromonospora phaseoli]PZW02257.1 putative zinc finger protein [Micromonospora phaseoli]GIJ75740.1 hypothetical protein Xph01_01720 [Micromonospora phaseoli]SEJ28402.1 Putative zinc-finger [Micromonospora phaseoli]